MALHALVACGDASGSAEDIDIAPREDALRYDGTPQVRWVLPLDGPFVERFPRTGPLRSAELRPEARVPPAEFFRVYAAKFGLGPKDEMQFVNETPDSFPYTGFVHRRYVQYHDGYKVEDGWFTLAIKDGLVHGARFHGCMGRPWGSFLFGAESRNVRVQPLCKQ